MRLLHLLAFCVSLVGGQGHGTDNKIVSDKTFIAGSRGRLPGAERNLTEAESNRLNVTFGPPKEVWSSGSKYLQISGKASLKTPDGKSEAPVDWIQPITIALATRPAIRPTWNDHLLDPHLCFATCCVNWDPGSPDVVQRDGTFTALLPVALLRRPVGKTLPFDIAVASGKRAGSTAEWPTDTKICRTTIQQMNISGPPVLSPEIEAINGVGNPLGYRYDPARLVRAVNRLRKLEKDQVLKILREYRQVGSYSQSLFARIPVPANLDDSDFHSLLLIIPLVFESTNPQFGLPLPPPMEGSSPRASFQLVRAGNRPSYFSITVIGGIPFHTLAPGPRSGGGPPDPTFLINWAETHGRIKKGSLTPSGDPLKSADDAFKAVTQTHPPVSKSSSDTLKRHLRAQGWRMIAHIVDPKMDLSNDRWDLRDDLHWAELKKKVAKLHLHWDEERQEYLSRR